MRIFAAFLLLLAFGCEQVEEGTEEIKIVHSFLESTINQDFEQLDRLLSDDFVMNGPASEQELTKSAYIEQWKSDWDKRYASISYKRMGTVFTSMEVSDEEEFWVSDWATITLTFKDGTNEVTFWYNGIFRIADNKIVHGRSFYDRADILEQYGHKIPSIR